jgi:predicted translin family RNA/ssDNA-binding protein
MDRITLGPDLLREMEQEVIRIKQNLKVAQDRQKSMQIEKELTRNSRWEIMCISSETQEELPKNGNLCQDRPH